MWLSPGWRSLEEMTMATKKGKKPLKKAKKLEATKPLTTRGFTDFGRK
jgi:hypothetical protein